MLRLYGEKIGIVVKKIKIIKEYLSHHVNLNERCYSYLRIERDYWCLSTRIIEHYTSLEQKLHSGNSNCSIPICYWKESPYSTNNTQNRNISNLAFILSGLGLLIALCEAPDFIKGEIP